MGRPTKMAMRRLAAQPEKPRVHAVTAWRNARGMSVSQLASGSGVHSNTIRLIEQGRGCHVDTAVQLIDFIEAQGGGVHYRDLRYNPL